MMPKDSPLSSAPVFPDRPEKLGQMLRSLREESEISLETIVEETKVSRRVFEALESGSYERLPQKIFCRNFLRQYATIIGLAHESLLAAFDRAWERFQMSSGSYPVIQIDDVPQRIFRWWLIAPLVLALVVAVTLGIMMVRSCQNSGELRRDPRRSPVSVAAGPTAFVPSPTPAFSPEPATPVPPLASSAQLQLEISVLPGRECWVRYRDQQGGTRQYLLRDGEKKKLDLPGPILLTIGNADAAIVRLGDRDFSGFGQPGQVVRLQVDQGKLQKLGSSEETGG